MTIAEALQAGVFNYSDEFELQDGVEQCLLAAGFKVEREVRVSPRDRLDMLVDGHVAVEVKVASKADSVIRQLGRYAEHEMVMGLVLVTNRIRHQPPETINGKPVIVVQLAGRGL